MPAARTACPALLVTLLFACGAEERGVPLLHLNADSRETAREAARAVADAGVPVTLVPVGDLDRDEIPAWLEGETEGWVLLGKAEDRQRAEQALAGWWAELKKRAPPPRPQPTPLTLGTRRALDEREVESIRVELARLRELDQAVRRDPRRRGEMAQVDAASTAYVTMVVVDVGWIDVERFGKDAADAAFLLVQHSGDLPLMLAALPEIEKDVRAGSLDPQNFALLYDRTQLMSGGKQRYGSQVRQKEDGTLVVWKLEDPDRVDEFRKQIGLRPLKDYLAAFGEKVTIER